MSVVAAAVGRQRAEGHCDKEDRWMTTASDWSNDDDEADGAEPWLQSAPAAIDRVAEQAIWAELKLWLAEQFAAGREPTQAEYATLVSDLVQRRRTRAALAGSPGVVDPAGLEARLLQRLEPRGYLSPLLDYPDIDEITVSAGRVHVHIQGRKYLVEYLMPEDDETERIVKGMTGPRGAVWNASRPIMEHTLEDGSRLTAVMPPASNQIQISIRRHVIRVSRMSTLIERFHMLTVEVASFLQTARAARITIALIGPTGAGKTTLCNCMLAGTLRPERERVVTMEEESNKELTAWRQLPDAIPLYAREANEEDAGAITFERILRTAVRMRPTMLVAGEIRGREAFPLLLALATGHAGLTTLHGDDARGALEQLCDFAQLAEARPSRPAVTSLVARTIGLVVVCGFELEGGQLQRRVLNVFEPTGISADGRIEGNDLWVIDPATGRLTWTGIQPRCRTKFARFGLTWQPPLTLLDSEKAS
jgi:pilus assembly protein CpaF